MLVRDFFFTNIFLNRVIVELRDCRYQCRCVRKIVHELIGAGGKVRMAIIRAFVEAIEKNVYVKTLNLINKQAFRQR